MNLFVVAAIAILISMALAVARTIAGPTIFDRILAVNMFGTKSVLLIAVFSFLSGRPDVLDIALLYSLLNWLGVLAALRMAERKEFYSTGADDSDSNGKSP